MAFMQQNCGSMLPFCIYTEVCKFAQEFEKVMPIIGEFSAIDREDKDVGILQKTR